MRGNWTGAGLYAAAAGMSLIPGAQGASLVTSLGATAQSFAYNPEEKKEQTPAKTTPQNKAIPPKKKQQTTPAAQSSSTNTAFIVSGTGEPESTSAPPPAQTAPPPAQTQGMPKSTEKLGQPTEPSPQVVMLNSPQAQSSQTPQSSLRSGSATDVPLFSSSNPDNFYSLYAQVNYNVIL